ncbi:MAG: zf-HC2 domain-containing protein [Fimbriimonadaceae bacterium]|nr:zf-HC2 domain-containing protein [Fimbriimonadaceae bacterium]
MSCNRFEPLLSAMIDGELDAQECWHVREHVSECEVCAAHLEALRALKWELGSISTPEPDEDSFARVRTRVVAEIGHSSHRPQERWGMAGGIAAASILAVLLAVQLSAPPRIPVATDQFDPSLDLGYAGSASTVSSYAPVYPVNHTRSR